MFGSSAGVPYWHQATASSPSKTRAACAFPSRTRRSFQGRPFSPSGLPSREWNHVHQQPPNPHPLCFSTRRANASHVEASSALISYSLTVDASANGGRVRVASLRLDPSAQPAGVLRDLLLRVGAQMTGGVADLDDAAGDVCRQPLAVRR